MGSIDLTPMPVGELALQTMAMPADTNPAGDIFGGWLVSQMDLAGGIAASICLYNVVLKKCQINVSYMIDFLYLSQSYYLIKFYFYFSHFMIYFINCCALFT